MVRNNNWVMTWYHVTKSCQRIGLVKYYTLCGCVWCSFCRARRGRCVRRLCWSIRRRNPPCNAKNNLRAEHIVIEAWFRVWYSNLIQFQARTKKKTGFQISVQICLNFRRKFELPRKIWKHYRKSSIFIVACCSSLSQFQANMEEKIYMYYENRSVCLDAHYGLIKHKWYGGKEALAY